MAKLGDIIIAEEIAQVMPSLIINHFVFAVMINMPT